MLVTTYGRYLVLFAVLMSAILAPAVAWADAPEQMVLLSVPQRSQFDGTVWGASNCGPASLAMVLSAYGRSVPTQDLRDRANDLLGIASPSTGTRIQDLARIAEEYGLSTFGLREGEGFRRWTLDEVRRELLAGRPVIPLVHYPLLPNHKGGVSTGHYIVIVGTAGDDFLFHDPADAKQSGFAVRMTAAEFTRAWSASRYPFAAFSVGPGPDDAPLSIFDSESEKMSRWQIDTRGAPRAI